MGYILDLQEEKEGAFTCPYCGSDLTNIDFDDLVFMCPECGEYIELARDNKLITTNIDVIKEEN